MTSFQDKLNAIKPQLALAAQKEYDAWDASDELNGDGEVGFGGICHLIADVMCDVIHSNIPEAYATTMSHDMGEVHVSVVTWDETEEGAISDNGYLEIYHVDIPPGNYETGGGYTWKKIPGVEFDASIVSIDRDSVRERDLQAIKDGY